MQALVASEDETVTKKIRAMLEDRAWQFEGAIDTHAGDSDEQLRNSKAELVVVVLPSHPSESDLLDLRKQIQGKMVVVGPADSKLILRVLHQCGADDYVDIDDLENELDAVLRRSARVAPGKCIAVMSPSGGGGSTTLAVNLATILAGKATRCAFIDLNLSAGDAAAMLDLKPVHSIADFARNAARMDRTLFSQMLTTHKSGVELLAAPIQFEDIPEVTTEAVRGAITTARTLFPYLVIDVDQSCSAEQIEAMKLADVILLVFELDFVSLHNLCRVLDYFGRAGVTRSRVRLVANRYGQSAEISPSQFESALNMRIDFYLPEDPKDVNRAKNLGVPLVVDRPRTKLAQSIGQLASELNGFA